MQIINKRDELQQSRNFFKKNYSKIYLLGISYNYQIENTIKALQEKNILIEGIIDDYYEESNYKGYKVIKLVETPKDAFVLSMVTATRMWTVINKLKAVGVENILTYWDLCLVDSSNFPLPYHCENNFLDIESNEDKYMKLYEILEDIKSKEILEHIIDFRYNLDVTAMEYFIDNISSKQYFDEMITNQEFEVFVDCGGFDGMTTIDFINYNPNYKTVYYFEPSLSNMSISEENLKYHDKIVYLNKGTYSKNTQLRFDGNQGSSAAISKQGENIIDVVKIDDIVKGEKIFIKMDIEGAEYDSLLGAEKLIKEKKPALAICVYHNQTDFWQIPELVRGMRDDYKIYLRHYSEGNLETVMYFI